MKKPMKKVMAWVLSLLIASAVLPLGPKVSAAVTGWVERDGVQYYLKDGERVYGWQYIDGRPCYFNENGALASIQGVDISEYNGSIDWQTLASAGCEFAMIRVGYRGSTIGGLYKDALFDTNMQGAQSVGMPVGVYFYSQAITISEAVEEAEYVMNILSKYPKTEYPVYIDVEETAGGGRLEAANLGRQAYTDIVLAFCDTLRAAGYNSAVYSYQSRLNYQLYADQFAKKGYDLWYAYYNIDPWGFDGDFQIWQYTGTGRIDGIRGQVDLNVSKVDYSGAKDLQNLGSKELLEGENAASEPENPTTPVDVSGYPLVRYGDSGEYVKTLQTWLNQAGYNCGSADGVYGNGTYNAVVKFQGDKGLDADGIVGQQTWKALAAAVAGKNTEPSEPSEPENPTTPVDVSGYSLVRFGDSGEYVKTLQTWLNQAGYNCGSADGVYGSGTYNAVVKFQGDKGLDADGIVGQQTWKALAAAVAGKNTEPSEPSEPTEPENPTTPVDVSGYSLVRYGDSGEYVKTLQTWLNQAGYNCGSTDGVYGSGTYSALVKFQGDKRLDADGIAGQQTWKALAAEVAGNNTEPSEPEKPSTPVDVSSYGTVRMGSTGEDVRRLQNRLNTLGYNCGSADGIYGNGTYSAVVKFQKDKGLDADGIVGQQTWRALYN